MKNLAGIRKKLYKHWDCQNAVSTEKLPKMAQGTENDKIGTDAADVSANFVICNKKENKCEVKLYKYIFAKG